MKIFGYEFRKFEADTTTLECIETWMVTWESMSNARIYPDKSPMAQAFTAKDQAELFAQELRDCRKLLGDSGFEVTVIKQKSPTNA